jgi:hypothetical protein
MGQRPQPFGGLEFGGLEFGGLEFGGLEFGGVGRQEEADEARGRFDFLGRVPAGFIEHQDDDLMGAGAESAGEGLRVFWKATMWAVLKRSQTTLARE